MSLENQTLALAIQIGKDVRALHESMVGGTTQTEQTDPLTQAIEDLESESTGTEGGSSTGA